MAAEQIRRYDACWDLWAALRPALAWFDREGKITDRVARQAELEAIRALRRALGGAQLQQERQSCAAGCEGYWGSEQRAQEVEQPWLAR